VLVRVRVLVLRVRRMLGLQVRLRALVLVRPVHAPARGRAIRDDSS
jgi:hypothetical protein